MKGFFDGIDPAMESCSVDRWLHALGCILARGLPSAMPGIAALSILCWLWTWNEFLFALILTGKDTPILTVTMAQFVTVAGTEWNLMSATAVIALVPALIVVVFGQKYVISGLRV